MILIFFHLSVHDAIIQIKPWRKKVKSPDVFRDPDAWYQVNKTSRFFTIFFYFLPDVWCHTDTVLICSVIITVFFNIICQYLNPFFTKLFLKNLVSFIYGGKHKDTFFRSKKHNAQQTHTTRTPARMWCLSLSVEKYFLSAFWNDER